MPINVFHIYISIPCNKSIVCFIHKLYYILKTIVVLCITLPCRRRSRPDGARSGSIVVGLTLLHCFIAQKPLLAVVLIACLS